MKLFSYETRNRPEFLTQFRGLFVFFFLVICITGDE